MPIKFAHKISRFAGDTKKNLFHDWKTNLLIMKVAGGRIRSYQWPNVATVVALNESLA
jgi:hypothetical protein